MSAMWEKLSLCILSKTSLGCFVECFIEVILGVILVVVLFLLWGTVIPGNTQG